MAEITCETSTTETLVAHNPTMILTETARHVPWTHKAPHGAEDIATLRRRMIPTQRDVQEAKKDEILTNRKIIVQIITKFPDVVKKELMLQSVLIWPELCGDESFISVFFEAFPDAALTRDEKGDFPLHVACHNEIPLVFSCISLKKLIHPEAAACKGSNGLFPIAAPFWYSIDMGSDDHLAFSEMVFGSPESPKTPLPKLFVALAQAHPTGLFAKGGFFDVTLGHIDVYNFDDEIELPKDTTAERLYIITVLREVYPEGLDTKDESGKTPLNIVCGNMMSASFYEVLPAVLNENESAAKICDSRGKTPLNTYLQAVMSEINGAPNERCRIRVKNAIHGLNLVLNPVGELVRAHPEAVNIPDDDGVTPLHIVCDPSWPLEWANIAWTVVKHANKECVSKAYANNGQLPLHRVLSDSRNRLRIPPDILPAGTVSPEEMIINKLIGSYSAAVSMVDPATGRLPLVAASKNGESVGTLFEILRNDPTALNICRESADQPPRKRPRLGE